ncbi:MAG: mechanosensitive ion channel domain-containing protein [Candidatus Bipolaricaulia bacterium]
MGFLTSMFYGNQIWRWLVALAVILFVWFVLRVLMRLIVRRFRRFAAKTPTRFDDLVAELLEKTKFLFVIVLSLYAGSLALVLPDIADRILRILFVLALLLQAGYWGNAFATFWINQTVRRRLEEDASSATSIAALGFVAKLAIWAVVILVALDNMGLDITTLIAGLGIGGIAIALAVQNILGDLFASLSIIIDKPFVIGDFIVVGDLKGSVERIGLKTTRVRSLFGEQIIFSNSDLLASRVRNYKQMYERRIAFSLGVTYDTRANVLERIPETVRQIIEAQPDVRFDRCHFKTFGDFSLDFEAVYYVLLPDYNVYMDRQQAINLRIVRAFEEQGIEFAYPTQTLFIEHSDTSE